MSVVVSSFKMLELWAQLFVSERDVGAQSATMRASSPFTSLSGHAFRNLCDHSSWLGRPLAPSTTPTARPVVSEQRATSAPSHREFNATQLVKLAPPLLLLHSLEMAPQSGCFDVLPADNTYPIEEYDMFNTVAKTPEPRHVPSNVGESLHSTLLRS